MPGVGDRREAEFWGLVRLCSCTAEASRGNSALITVEGAHVGAQITQSLWTKLGKDEEWRMPPDQIIPWI